MEAWLVLSLQVQALQKDLELAEKGLTAPAIREDLRERVSQLFGGLINNCKEDLGMLRRKLVEQPSGPALEAYWDEFARNTEVCRRVLREYLAFLQGALVRSARLDDGLCDVADTLLEQLGRWTDIGWPRLTILGEGEVFANMTDIIRLRYPPSSIWNLPVVAHEFGHFITPRVKDRLTGTEPLKHFRNAIRAEMAAQWKALPREQTEAEIEKTLHHLDEFWADLFAVYSVGPAYACTCILLRFNPRLAYCGETAEHPSPDQRTYALLRTLETLDPIYEKVTELLRGTWQESVVAAGLSDPQTTHVQAKEWLDGVLDRLYVIVRKLPPESRFRAWSTASELSQRLGSQHWDAGAESKTFAVRDVLNAAWLCRLDNGESNVPRISARALALCRRMLDA